MNVCAACNEDFSSVTMFDRHRVGSHQYDWSIDQEDGRRCLDLVEMSENGWERDRNGRWTDPVRNAQVREAFAAVNSHPEAASDAVTGAE